jgi:hypothetical protein
MTEPTLVTSLPYGEGDGDGEGDVVAVAVAVTLASTNDKVSFDILARDILLQCDVIYCDVVPSHRRKLFSIVSHF